MELILSLLFIVNPVSAILLYLFFCSYGGKSVNNSAINIGNRNVNWRTLYISFLCIILVSLVNATKVAESDLMVYYDSYIRAYNVDFFTYWASSGKWGDAFTDVGYVAYSWVMSNITHANTAVFIFVLSFVSYLFLCIGIVNWGNFLKLPQATVFAAIIIACFYPYIFTRSAHVLRQFVSMCLLFYVISRVPTSSSIISFFKKNWFVIVVMVLFHKSSLFFVLLLGIPLFRRNIRDNKIMYLCAMIAIVAYKFIAALIAPYIGISTIGSAVEQVNQNVTVQLEGYTIVEYVTILIFFIVFLRYAYKVKLSGGMLHVFNIILILTFFVIINFNEPSIGRRFFYYLLVFLPLVWLMIGYKHNIPPIMNIFISIAMILGFIVYVEVGPWVYKIDGNVLTSPVFLYNYNVNGQ